jgi:plastocyanin
MRRLLPAAALLAVLSLACTDDPTAGPGSSRPPESPGSTASPTTTPTPSPTVSASDQPAFRVVVAGGKVVEGPKRAEVRLGETVRLEVISDHADTVHVHGYDKEFDVGPGKAGVLELAAKIPGTFEVELHDAELVLMQLRVR